MLTEIDGGYGTVTHWSGAGYRMLSWAPSGRLLVLADKVASLDGVAQGLVLLSPDSGQKQVLTSLPGGRFGDAGDGQPAFSPDGRTLVFVRRPPSDLYALSITVQGQPAGEPTRLTFEGTSIAGLDWLPDGRSMVFSGGNEASGHSLKRAYLGKHRGPARVERVPLPAMMAVHPSVSPRGERLAYMESVRNLSIWRAPGPFSGQWSTEGASVSAESFIASTRVESTPEYSPDGKKIAFRSTRTGNWEIWLCDSDGSHPRPLTAMAGKYAQFPSWPPDSQWVAFTTRDEGIWIVDTRGDRLRRITSGADELAPSWSRDGKWIYFGSVRSGEWQIWKVPSEGGAVTQVTRNGGWQALETPDRRFLYYIKRPALAGIWKGTGEWR